MPRIAAAIELDSQTRMQLQSLVRSPSTSQALVARSRSVLAAAEGKLNQQIAQALGIPEVTVGKWRRSFVALGLEG